MAISRKLVSKSYIETLGFEVFTRVEMTYKEKLSHCMKSKRIAIKEVNPQNVKFSCKMVKAETEIYMGEKKILRIINE